MATQVIKITRQSLRDYEVTVGDKHVAWISRAQVGWNVSVKDVGEIPYLRFNDAKKYATQQAQIAASY